MENLENIDLNKTKLVPNNEIYLLSVVEGIRENYPNIELEKELEDLGFSFEDFTQSEKIKSFMKLLHKKYPNH